MLLNLEQCQYFSLDITAGACLLLLFLAKNIFFIILMIRDLNNLMALSIKLLYQFFANGTSKRKLLKGRVLLFF